MEPDPRDEFHSQRSSLQQVDLVPLAEDGHSFGSDKVPSSSLDLKDKKSLVDKIIIIQVYVFHGFSF